MSRQGRLATMIAPPVQTSTPVPVRKPPVAATSRHQAPARRSALLFAPPPAPAAAYVAVLEGEGFDVLLAQDTRTADTLLRSATPRLVLAVAPSLGEELMATWRSLAPEAEIRLFSGLGPLLEERVAPTAELVEFTVRILTAATQALPASPSFPHGQIGDVIDIAGKAATALRLGPRDHCTTRLSAVASMLAHAIDHAAATGDGATDNDGTVALDPNKRRRLAAALAAATHSPFPIGGDPPTVAMADRAPVPEEIVEAACRLAILREVAASDPVLELRRQAMAGESDTNRLHPAAVEAVIAAASSSRRQSRGEILLVDDDASSRGMLALRLQNEGYTVRSAASGRTALEEIRRKPPALVLSETVLPGMDGYGLLDAIKREPGPAPPFLFLSARSDALSINKGLLLGAGDFLTKGLNFEVLLTKLDMALAQSVDHGQASTRLTLSDLSKGATTTEYPLVSYEELQLGTKLMGRFQIEADLGEGGMGKIFRATDERLEEQVVIKVMKPGLAEEVLSRFKREIRLARKITHPSVVRIFDFWEAGTLAFVTMELLEGADLNRELERRGRFPVPVALRVGHEVLDALGAAHEVGVLHRDIKPHNVVLLPTGRVKVLDFGIAQGLGAGEAEQAQLTQTGFILGTPDYMSPEQLLGKKLDARSDLYSAGVMLFELLTGLLPFRGDDAAATFRLRLLGEADPPSTVDPTIGPEIDQFVMRLLARECDKRFESAAAAVAAVAELRGRTG